MDNFWTRKNNKPVLVLAPMAGYTDAAFRLLCRHFGADIVVTELVSADAIAYCKNLSVSEEEHTDLPVFENLTLKRVISKNNKPTAELLTHFLEEKPLVVQLFGKHSEKFGLAAKWITEHLKPAGIDINMGCPARKVVGSDHGAALLKDCGLALEIVRAVKENTNLPVSVKTRLGWDSDDQILEFGPALFKAGINAITLHGRTYKDGFNNRARWENIYKLKELVPELAVIGNGDVKSYAESVSKANGSVALDGVAIGRGSYGNPKVFLGADKEINKELISLHAKLAFITKGEHGMLEFRKHLLTYLKGFSGAKELRMKATQVQNLEDVTNILSSM